MRNRVVIGALVVLAVVSAFFAGTLFSKPSENITDAPVFTSGWYDRAFYEAAYAKARMLSGKDVVSILSAHHLLVADKMAEVFEVIASDQPKTVIVVGPNHFSVGASAAQVSFGAWETPYGIVQTHQDAAKRILDQSTTLQHEERAFAGEHSIGALTPFIARSLPNARIVPIIVHDSLSAQEAWELGWSIAQTVPEAILVASVDMAHYMDAERTAQVDEAVLERIEDGWMCDDVVCQDDVQIDSNASMRFLAGFNAQRGASSWTLTHHGSSLEMGATNNPADNTSHILGFFQ